MQGGVFLLFLLIKYKWKLTVYGGKNAELWGLRMALSKSMCKSVGVRVAECCLFQCAESTPSPGKAELLVPIALKGSTR